MAIISSNVSPYIAALNSDPAAWTALREANPSKTELRVLLQGLENWFEANRPAIKTAMETEAGITISPALAKKLFRVWMQLKYGGE
jgi:hypothetical protein